MPVGKIAFPSQLLILCGDLCNALQLNELHTSRHLTIASEELVVAVDRFETRLDRFLDTDIGMSRKWDEAMRNLSVNFLKCAADLCELGAELLGIGNGSKRPYSLSIRPYS